MRQPVMRHARSCPPLERTSGIVEGLIGVTFHERDTSTTPGQCKADGETRWAGADNNHLYVGHAPSPLKKGKTTVTPHPQYRRLAMETHSTRHAYPSNPRNVLAGAWPPAIWPRGNPERGHLDSQSVKTSKVKASKQARRGVQ